MVNLLSWSGLAPQIIIRVFTILSLGLRKVKPYYYVYEANAKGRWLGRSILEIFTQEFQDQSPDYYVRNTEFVWPIHPASKDRCAII